MDRSSSNIGSSGSHHLNRPAVPDPLTSRDQSNAGVDSIQVPNQLQQGDRPITTPIGDRDITSVEVDAPSIPKPYSMVCRATAKPNSSVPEHTLFRLRESITPETVETASRKTKKEMAERVGRLQDQLGWRFKMPANSQQLESNLNGSDGHLMTLAMARSMVHQIEVMETGVADAITASGQSKEAWKKGLLQRHKLEKMHREVLALAEFYCHFYPEPTKPEESIPYSDKFDPIRELDEQFRRGKLDLPPLVPTLSIPRPPEGPALSIQSLELSKVQQAVKNLRKEKEELGTELQQTRKQLTELKEEIEALKQKEGTIPESVSERLDQLEKEHAELKGALKDKDRKLRQKQHQSINFNGSPSGASGLGGTDAPDTRLNELEALNRQLQLQMNEQTRMLGENGFTISQLQTQMIASGQHIDNLQSQLQAASVNHEQFAQQAFSALEQKNQQLLQLRQEYLDSYQQLENELAQERDRLAEIQQSYKNAEERVGDLFRQNGLLHLEIKSLKEELEELKQTDPVRVEQLERQVKDLTESQDRWIVAHVDVSEKKKHVEEKARELEERLNNIEEIHKQEIDQLQRKFEEVQNRAISAEDELFALEGDYQGALAREKSLKKELSDTKKDLRDKVKELKRQQSEFEVKARSLKEVHLERQKYDREIKDLQQEIVELKGQVRSEKFLKSQALEEKARFEKLLVTKQSELEALQQKYDVDLKDLDELHVQLDEARGDISAREETIKRLESEAKRLRKDLEGQLSQKDKELTDVRKESRRLKTERDDFETRLGKSEANVKRLESDLVGARKARESSETRLKELQKQLREAGESDSKEKDGLRDQIKVKEKARETARRDADRYKKELEVVKSERDTYKRQKEIAESQLSEARDEINSLKEQVQSLQLIQSSSLQASQSHEDEMGLIREQLRKAEQKHQKEKIALESEVEKAKSSEKRVQTQLRSKDRELSELQSRLENTERELKEKIAGLEKNLRSKDEDISQRDQELVVERRKVQELTVKSSGLEEAKGQLESSLEDLRSELESTQRATRSSKEEVIEYTRKLQEAEDKAGDLETKLEDAKGKERAAREHSAIADETLPKLKGASERYQRELQLSQQEVIRLKGLLTGKEDELAEAKIKENTLSSTISSKDDRIRQLEEAETQFRSEIEKANRRTQEKQEKVNVLSQQVDEKTHTVEQLTFRIQKLTPEKELSDNKVIELEGKIQSIERERDEAKQNLLKAERSLQSGNDTVEVEKAKWESQLKESRARVSELEGRLTEVEKKRDHFKSESNALAHQRDQVKKELQELQISVDSLRSQHALEIERLTRERGEFKLEVEALQLKAEVSSADWDKEKARIEEAKDKLFGDLKNQHDQLLEVKKQLDQELLDSQEEVRKTKFELSQKDSTLGQKEQRIEFINEQLASVQQELSQLKETSTSSSSELRAKVTQLNKEKSELEAKLQKEEMAWDLEKVDLTRRATKAEEERLKFEEQLTSMKDRLEESQAKAMKLDGQFSELTRNYGALEIDIKNITGERDRAQKDLQRQGEELNLVRGSFEQAEIKLKALERLLDDEKRNRSIEVTDLKRQISLAEENRDHFKTLSETAETQKQILDRRVSELDESLRNSQIEACRLQGNIDDLNVKHERELKEAQSRSSQLEKDLALQEKRHKHDASGWNEEKERLTSSHERVVVDLKGQLEKLQNLKDEVDNKVSQLELQGKSKDLELQQKSQALEVRKEEVGRLQSETESLRVELKTLTDQAREATSDHTLALKEKELANQRLVQSLEREQGDRDKEKRKLERDISSLELERNGLQTRLTELQAMSMENQTLLSTASELREELHSTQKELDKLKQKKEEVEQHSEEALKAKATMQSQLEAEQFRVSTLTEAKKELEAAVRDKEKALEVKSSELATASENLQRESDQLKQLRLQVVTDNHSDSGNESDTASTTGLSRLESVSSTTFSDLASPSSEKAFDLTKGPKAEIMPKWTEIGPIVLEIKDETYASLGPGTLAIPGLIQRMRTAWHEVASEQEMMEKELAVYHFTSLDDLPSKTNYRSRVKALHEKFLKQLDSVDHDYQKAISSGATSEATSEVPLTDDFTRQIEMTKALTRGNILILGKKQDDFQEQVAKLASSLEALKQKDPEAGPEDPEAIVNSELTNMTTMLSKNPGDIGTEFYTHAVCAIVKSASERLNESWRKKVATIRDVDEGHRALQQYEYSLQRLAPEHLPPKLRVSVPEQGRLFLSKLVEGRKAELEAKLDEQLGGGHKALAGITLEEQMLKDSKICDRLLTLVSSLQAQHEGITKQPKPTKLSKDTTQWVDFSYADASLVGLSQIRDEFELPATPTMANVLRTLQKELKSPGSLVLAIAVKQHKENYKTGKERETRRRKLEKQCTELLAEEGKLKPEQKLRGVSHDAHYQRQKHPHEAEIACFQPDSPVPLVEVSEHVQPQAGFKCSALAKNPNCLMNSFMDGFSKTAVHKTSIVTGDQYIELSEGAKCQPSLVFFSKDGKHWNIQLDGRTWALDPAFLHDHPNYEIPFQINAEGREKKRDWIPLKSASGQTVILVAQKTPLNQQCYMYELGSNNQLIPIPVQGGNVKAELIRANLLSKACLLKPGSPVLSRAHPNYSNEVTDIDSLTRSWLPNVSTQQLQSCYLEVVREVESKVLKPPFSCTPCDGRVRSLPVELPVLRKVAQEKSRKPKTGAHQETFHPEQFTGFTVNASFGHVSDSFLKAKRDLLDESAHGVSKTLEGQQKAFQEQVFKNLSVYSGCELKSSGAQRLPDPVTLKANRQTVLSNFEKVIVNNRKHCVRTLQLKKALESGLVSYIRNASENDLKGYSDGELLDHAIRNFERGLAPGGDDVDGYIKRMSQLMLVDIDLEQSSLIGQRLEALQHELVGLDFAAFEQVNEPHEYTRRCQEWNLNMALVASRQNNLNSRISSYENSLLDTKNLALLSFERRHHIVLSSDQAEELAVTLEGVSQWAKGREVAMMSHKGTGYGKSTLLLALTDHACAQLDADIDADTHRSVIVMAPKTNQAELDKGLREYYARKGQNYCRLNLEASFAQPCEISVAKLIEVENTLLGLPANTPPGSRKSLLVQGRVPVGASINDVQILMHLKQALLDAQGMIQDKQAILAKVDNCLDLLRNSMVFADEFDSAMVPHTEAELISVAQSVQTVISGLGYDLEVEPRSINLKHSEFLFGCKARHLLSATLGTLYCAALASAASSVEEVRQKARTDPVTTNQRFWHFLSLAEPVFFKSSDAGSRKKLLTDVLHRVGPKPQIMFFDGAESGEQCTQKAHEMSRTLNQARLAMGGVQKSVIYYDHEKNLQMQYQDDPVYGEGSTASAETVTLLRRTGGQSTDGYLSKEQSVGTDMPQGGTSVGVFHGLIGQAGGEANENYLVQQLGRLTRDSKDLHKAQRVFMAVDLDAVEGIKGADKQKEAFNAALKLMNDSLQSTDNLFPDGMDKASPALMKVVEQTMSIPIQKTEEEGGYLKSVSLKEKLVATGIKEWAELGLSHEAFEELVVLKTRQWVCKNAWLELIAIDIANREKSNHTLNCEQELTQARTNSHLEKVYAEEHRWLNEDGVTLVDECKMKAHGIPAEAVPVVTNTLKSELKGFLQSVERRVVLPGTDQEDLVQTADAKTMREGLTQYFSQLERDGIRLSGRDLVGETNEKLILESDAALEEAHLRIRELYTIVENIGAKASGKEYFKDIMDSLQESRRKLRRSGGVHEAMQTEATVKRAYSSMMDAVMKVVVYPTTTDVPAIEKQIMTVITECVDLDPDLRLSLQKNGIGIDRIKAIGLKPPKEVAATKQTCEKFRWKKKGQKGQWTLIGNTKQAIIDCDVAKDHFKIKGGYIPNIGRLNGLQQQASSLKGRQTELDDAIKLCSHPVKKEFKACVEELEKAVMDQFDRFTQEQQRITEREQKLMLKQSELRQSKLYKVLV